MPKFWVNEWMNERERERERERESVWWLKDANFPDTDAPPTPATRCSASSWTRSSAPSETTSTLSTTFSSACPVSSSEHSPRSGNRTRFTRFRVYVVFPSSVGSISVTGSLKLWEVGCRHAWRSFQLGNVIVFYRKIQLKNRNRHIYIFFDIRSMWHMMTKIAFPNRATGPDSDTYSGYLIQHNTVRGNIHSYYKRYLLYIVFHITTTAFKSLT